MIEKIKNTRSHRKFTNKKISKEEILKIWCSWGKNYR